MTLLSVNTKAAANITNSSMTLSGEIASFDGSRIDGACSFFEYDTSTDGSGNLSDPKHVSGETGPGDLDVALFGTGTYSGELTGLDADTTYYYKARSRVIKYDDPVAMDYAKDSFGFMDDLAAVSGEMDKVTNSDTAMDKVASDVMSRTKMLNSLYVIDTMWSKAMSSEVFWNSGGSPDIGTDNQWSTDLDLTDISTLKLKVHKDSGDGWSMSVLVSGSEVLNISSATGGWEEKTVDVSTYSGTTTITLKHNGNDDPFGFDAGPTGDGKCIRNFESSGDIDGFADIKLE